MKKLLISFLSMLSLSVYGSHLADLNAIASQINSHIDHSHKDKSEKTSNLGVEESKTLALREAKIKEEKEKAAREAKLDTNSNPKSEQHTNSRNDLSKSELEFTLSEKQLYKMARTYGLYLNQDYELEQIKKHYPSLKGQVISVQNEFHQKFGPSLENINALMLKENARTWNEVIHSGKEILQKRGIIAKSKQEAMKTIEDMKSFLRMNWSELSDKELSSLLVFNPRYLSSPHLEFAENYTYRFNTKGHNKSKGIDFSVKLPVSWQAQEGDRPNVIQRFTNYNGSGLSIFSLAVQDASPETEMISIELLKEVFSDDNDKREFSSLIIDNLDKGSKSKYISSNLFILENKPGVKICFEVNRNRTIYAITMESCSYIVFYNQKMIFLQGSTAKYIDSQAISDGGIKKYEKLFDLIANSLVINDLYKN